MYIMSHEAMTEEYRDDIEEMEEDDDRTFGEWLQDNLRVIISVIIVLLLALGIYSYSKRSQEARMVADTSGANTATETSAQDDGGVMAQIGDAVTGGAKKAADTAAAAAGAAKDAATGAVETAKNSMKKDDAPQVMAQDDARNTTAARDTLTGDAYTLVARAGDGKTHLARRALSGYLAQHPVDGLTAAHKVYIEDYLQKAVGGPTMLRIGQEVRFSTDLIKQAIERAQRLNDMQLRNLQKYAAAASLS